MDIVDDFVTSFYQDDEAHDHEAQCEEEDGEFYDSYQVDPTMTTGSSSDDDYCETFGQEELDFLEEWIIDENIDIFPGGAGSNTGEPENTEH